jgi:hypothetical protein
LCQSVTEILSFSANLRVADEQLKELRGDHITDFVAFRAFDQAIESARINTLWMDSFYDKIVSWFEDNVGDLKALREQTIH